MTIEEKQAKRQQIGIAFKLARQSQKKSQREVADKLGITYPTICHVEQGSYNYSIDIYNALKKEYDIKL